MGLLVLGASAPVLAQGAGSVTVTACLPCHGGGAAGAPAPAAPTFPTLDGQHAAYLEKQLREYKSGKRKSDVMAPLIGALQKQQIPGMAAHFASQAPVRGAVQNPQLAASGKVLYEEGNRASGVPACVGCHLPGGAGHQRYPRLGGQLQAYIVQQLADFKSGKRSNDRARVMRLLAGRLTEDEMRAVAEYLAGLE
jgi:cytochrome c553